MPSAILCDIYIDEYDDHGSVLPTLVLDIRA